MPIWPSHIIYSVIPGLGIVTSGPIAAGLAGAGRFTGGIIGAMVGSGIPGQKIISARCIERYIEQEHRGQEFIDRV